MVAHGSGSGRNSCLGDFIGDRFFSELDLWIKWFVCEEVFTTKAATITKFGDLTSRTRRLLCDLRGKPNLR
jgi:hypothetical protein